MKALLVHFPDLPWSCLTQDSAAQLVPTFLRLIENGSAGTCAALGPQPVMDGLIATGRLPSESGLLTRQAVRADGFGTDVMSALDLKMPAVWDYLDAAGHRCASINMRASNFGRLESGIVVGDAFCDIRSHHADDWGIPPGALAPVSMASTLADYRVHPSDLDSAHWMPFLAHEPAVDKEAKIRVVAKMLAENSTAHAAATYLLAQGTLDFLAVRYPAMAQLRHDFSNPTDTPAGQGAAWQCLHLLDAFLARLIELAGGDVLVVVSGGTADAPFWIAHGPGVAHDVLWGSTTSLYDVAPSLLAQFGLHVSGMRGRVPPQLAFAAPLHECPAPRGATDSLAPEAIAITAARFGVPVNAPVTRPSKAQEQMIELQRFRTWFAQAEVARLEGRFEQAAEAYRAALELRPTDPATVRGLSQCMRAKG